MALAGPFQVAHLTIQPSLDPLARFLTGYQWSGGPPRPQKSVDLFAYLAVEAGPDLASQPQPSGAGSRQDQTPKVALTSFRRLEADDRTEDLRALLDLQPGRAAAAGLGACGAWFVGDAVCWPSWDAGAEVVVTAGFLLSSASRAGAAGVRSVVKGLW